MPFFDEQIIEQIQRATDIVQIVGDYVPLKRAGRNLKACCPFHKEKTPSFIVTADRQTYHCFGCGVGGDVFDFIMRIDSLTFVEAVRHLADLAHIDLPETTSPENAARSSRREKLLSLYDLAQRFFRAYYKDETQGAHAREYMLGRKFKPEILEEFGVGYAPALARRLFESLKKKGIPEEELLSSGLVSRSQYGNVIDLFRDRVMFPISNVQGKIIGFGGRVMGDEMPKYINSPESDVFKKRQELYALHIAKRHVDRDDPFMIIVEGYLDVMRLHEAGIRNAVATLGTALTEEHAKLLKRYVKEIVLVFDGDAAGEAASLRGLETFLGEEMSIRLVAMPEGNDPDDFVRDHGGDAFRELLKRSEDIFTFKLKSLMKHHNHREPKGLLNITRSMVELLAKIPNAVLLDRYTKQLSTVLGVQEESIALELAKVHDKLSARPKAETTEVQAPSAVPSKAPFQAEYAIISLMVEDKTLADKACDLLSASDFQSRETTEVFERLRTARSQGGEISARVVFHWELSDTFKSYLSAHPFQHLPAQERLKALEQCAVQLRKSNQRDDLNELRVQIRTAEHEGNAERVADLLRRFQERVRK